MLNYCFRFYSEKAKNITFSQVILEILLSKGNNQDYLFSGERPFKCKVCKMSFTTNGNMHRHMRIHSKETDIEALGTKIRKKTPTFKPKAMFFSPIDFDGTSLNMSTPIPSREFSPKGLNFGEPTTPSSYMSPKGLKRTFNFVDCSPNWSLPKRQLLEERFNSALPPQSISSFIPLVVPQESPKIPSELTAEVKGEPEPQRVPVAVRQVIPAVIC